MMKPTKVTGVTKLEVALAGQELERRGFECIHPISEDFDSYKKRGKSDRTNVTELTRKFFAIYRPMEVNV